MKFIISLLLLSLAVCSCNNHPSRKDKIMQEFDSVNNALNKLQADRPMTNIEMYDSLQKAMSDEKGKYNYIKLEQMRHTVADFSNYSAMIRRQFYQFCGDTAGEKFPPGREDSVGLSRAFFLEKKSMASLLFPQLSTVVYSFERNATSQIAKDMIHKLSSVTTERFAYGQDFMASYFKDAPPFVAITIINSFEAQVKNTELRILNDYLNQ